MHAKNEKKNVCSLNGVKFLSRRHMHKIKKKHMYVLMYKINLLLGQLIIMFIVGGHLSTVS